MKYSWRVVLPILVVTAAMAGCSDNSAKSAASNQPVEEDVSQVTPEVIDGGVPTDIFHLSETATCDASVEPIVNDYSFEVRGTEFIFYITVEKNVDDTEVGAQWIAAQIEWEYDEDQQPTVAFVVYAPFSVSVDESVVTLATTPDNDIESEESLQVALIRMSASGDLCWTGFKTEIVTVSEYLPSSTNPESDPVEDVLDDNASDNTSTEGDSDNAPAQAVLSVETENRTQDGLEFLIVSVGFHLLDPMHVCLVRERDGERILLINAGSHIGLLPEGESYVEFWINKNEVSVNDADMFFLMGSPGGACYAEMNPDTLIAIE